MTIDAMWNHLNIKAPKVSVLMPVFNSSRYIKESVESVLSQSFNDFEFVIVDDGSTDETPAILEEYALQDNRIRIIRNEKNMGIVYALNRGLKVCHGDYIVRMDADDVATQDRLKKQVAAMEADSRICVLGGALTYIDAEGNDLGVVRYCRFNDTRLSGTPLLHPTVIIRRAVLLDNRLNYSEKYKFAEDYFLWLQLSKVGKVSAINDVVLKYRINSNATKIKRLKATLLATLKVKKDAVLLLHIFPRPKDIIIACAEIILLLLPWRLVLFIYLKMTFGSKSRINL